MGAERELNAYRQALTARFQQEEQELLRYFTRLRGEVELAHEKSLFNLKIYYEAQMEEVERLGEGLGLAWNETQSIKDDILPNVGSIVEVSRVCEESFRIIISNHLRYIQNAEERLREVDRLERVCYTCNY